MAGITEAAALAQIQALTNSQITVQAVKDIYAQVDASVATGKTAIFNSGKDTFTIIENLKASDSNLSSIGDTEIGKLRENDLFEIELQRAIDHDPNVNDPIEKVMSGRDANDVRIPGETNSFDDIGSGKYATEAKGNIKIISIDPDPNSVFIQSEKDNILNNGGSGTINDAPRANINAGNSLDNIKQSSALEILKLDDTQTGIGKSGAQFLVDEGSGHLIKDLGESKLFTKAHLESLGKIGTVVLAAYLVFDVGEALAAGNPQQAADLLAQFVVDETAGTISFAIASGAFTLLLAAAPFTVPVLVGGALAFTAGLVGSIVLTQYIEAIDLADTFGIAESDPRIIDYTLNGTATVTTVNDIYMAGHHIYGDDGWTDVLDSTPNLVQGADTVTGIITGTDEDDLILGGIESDILYGGDGNGDDTLIGDAGDDTLIAGKDDTTLDGGEGEDWADYSYVNEYTDTDITINLSSGIGFIDHTGPINDDHKLYNIENVIAGENEDTITGNEYTNIIYGMDGDDSIEGYAGDDSLFGGRGSDDIDGGIGFDWISYVDHTYLVPDTVTGGETVDGFNVEVTITGQDTVLGGFSGTTDEWLVTPYTSTDTFTGIEGIELTYLNDHIFLDQMITDSQVLSIYVMGGTDVLHGTDSAETIDGVNFFITLPDEESDPFTYGSPAVFRVDGGDGDDSIGNFAVATHLFGGAGEDTVEGGAGEDTLNGGSNDDTNDTLKGGIGNDWYMFDQNAGIDTIIDTDNVGTLYHTNSGAILSGLATTDVDDMPSGFTLDNDQWILRWNYDGSGNYWRGLIEWDGDPTVENSSGQLRIDFDVTGIDDLIIEDFTNTAFGITIEGAEPGDGGGGEGTIYSSGGRHLPIFANYFLTETEDGQSFVVGGYSGTPMSIQTSTGLTHVTVKDISSTGIQIASTGGSYVTTSPRNWDFGPGSPPVGHSYTNTPAGSVGDPHKITFDGLIYDFQDAGEFTLVKSTDSSHLFEIQVRQESWDMPGASQDDLFSVNTAVATEIGSTKVGLYINGSLPWDASLHGFDDSVYTDFEPVLYLDDEALLLPDKMVVFVEDGMVFRDGITFTVLTDYGDGFTADVYDDYIDVRPFLSALRGENSLQGLLGDDDGNNSNDFQLKDGTLLGETLTADVLYDTFGEEWRITQGESLFLYGTGQDTSSFNNANFANTVTDLSEFTTTEINTAEAALIAKGFDENSDIFDAMVLDYLVLGDIEHSEILQLFEEGDFEFATITETSTNVIMGTVNNDAIYGTVDEDYILALAGDDTVYGRIEEDTLIGGAGNDTIYGEGGSDIFIHYGGDGNDVLHSINGDLADVIMNGVSSEDLYLDVDGYNLIVTDAATGENVTLFQQYYNTGSGYKFGTLNGELITNSIHARGTSATAGEIIYGSFHHGDTLEGGLGNDTLYGNGGTDEFIHNIGDGNDELHVSNGSLSTITMEGVNPWDIRLEVSSYNVKAINKNNDETITFFQQLYNTGSGYKFDNVNGINLIGGLELEGDDTSEAIYGTVNDDTIMGMEGNDTITGQGGTDLYIINEGDGNDLLIANNGNLSTIALVGISAADLRFNVSGYNLLISNVINSDVITLQNQYYQTTYGYKFASINGIDLTTGLTVEGSDSGDTLHGTDQADSILGGDGADTIYGGLGNDTLVGGGDDDSVYGEGDTDVFIHGSGDGSDQLFENPNALAIVTMNGVNNADIYFTVDGYNLYVTDTTNGEQLTLYNQYYQTGSGYKFATVNGMDVTGGLTIKGTSATAGEHIKGTANGDTLEGGLGNDTIEGLNGDDIFIHNVGDGNDVLYSWNDAEATITMNGVAAGDILLNVSGNNLIITDDATGETLTLINQLYQTNYGYKFDNVNGINLMGGLEITGSDSANVLYGTANVDTIVGGEGNDTLYGNGSADSFVHYVGDDNDSIYTNNGNLATITFDGVSNDDLLFSGSGYNLIVTDTNTGESVTLYNQYHNIGAGYKFASVNGITIDHALITGGTDNADSINGSGYADSISGGLLADTINGGTGNDTIEGESGNDVLNGDYNNDVLYGGDGNDTLNGGVHNDTLEGGTGDDQLTGYTQNDTFVFIGSSTGDDTITDFAAGYDILQFDSAIFATDSAAVAAFSSGVIDLGGGNTVTLTGISSLSTTDVEII